jgi:hypothetical protein
MYEIASATRIKSTLLFIPVITFIFTSALIFLFACCTLFYTAGRSSLSSETSMMYRTTRCYIPHFVILHWFLSSLFKVLHFIPGIGLIQGSSKGEAQQIIEGRGVRAGSCGPPLIHTYIHTYIHCLQSWIICRYEYWLKSVARKLVMKFFFRKINTKHRFSQVFLFVIKPDSALI